ncbi:hypothetical protein FRC08_007528 [Ceratobasidium sp. 394]|nr:hypothetical protein FRC08_007528 [Ceratobasidium sp. 394]
MLRSALEEWKAARTILSDAIRSYQAACSTLSAICITYLPQSAGRATIEESLIAIDSELESLESDEAVLREARILLAATRNKSATLAPVNKLPPEILSRALALSRSYCVHDDNWNPAEFRSLTAVCTYWRQVAMDATELWAHIDVGPGAPVGLANLLFARAKNHAVHLHLCGPALDQHQPAPGELAKSLDILASHIHRVGALEIYWLSDLRVFTGRVLDLWLNHGSASLSRFLKVDDRHGDLRSGFSLPRYEDNYGETAGSQSENAKNMLRSIRVLHLRNVHLGIGRSAYHNLVDLRLASDRTPVPISQLAALLSANPALVILKLGLSIDSAGAWSYPTPIQLSCLKVLNLCDVQPDAGLVLSLIVPPCLSTEFSVGLQGSKRTHDTLLEFFVRSQITTLYCSSSDLEYTFSLWPHLLTAFHHLTILVLHNFDMSDVDAGIPAFSGSGLSSRLPFVVLLECAVTFEGLVGLIGEHSIQDLRLEMCYGPEWDGAGLENIRILLLEIYPELRCHISDVDSTRDLPCRSMFD